MTTTTTRRAEPAATPARPPDAPPHARATRQAPEAARQTPDTLPESSPHPGLEPARLPEPAPRRARLPKRPRLLPGLQVLRRGESEVQLGLDPRHALVIAGAEPELAETLRALDGTTTLASVLARATEQRAQQLRTVLGQLARRGLVEDASTGTGRPDEDIAQWALRCGDRPAGLAERCAHSMVALHGGGPLATAVAGGLAAAGVGHIAIDADRSATGQNGGWTAAAQAATRQANPATLTAPAPSDRRPELAVLTDTLVPDPDLVRSLMVEQVPHLLVRVREGTGIVGPLVLPRRTSCLHCADLHRVDRDTAWPRLANQLTGRAAPAGSASVTATAGLAVAQAVQAVQASGRPHPAWNATMEFDVFTARLRRREWPTHPRCGCGR